MRSAKSLRNRGDHRERGSATAEFTMVAALLMVVFLVTLQFAGMVHARNTLTDAASHGARYGALADRTAADGAARTQQLIDASLAGSAVSSVGYEYQQVPEGRLLTVTVTGQVPILLVLGGIGEIEVSGSAYEFS